jgi:hypothetical protein
MVYILHQRLHAQGIPPDKGVKVLQDIVGTLFERRFVADKLFVPQDAYSLQATRKVFDRIAHSSIMKLSENRFVWAGGGVCTVERRQFIPHHTCGQPRLHAAVRC